MRTHEIRKLDQNLAILRLLYQNFVAIVQAKTVKGPLGELRAEFFPAQRTIRGPPQRCGDGVLGPGIDPGPSAPPEADPFQTDDCWQQGYTHELCCVEGSGMDCFPPSYPYREECCAWGNVLAFSDAVSPAWRHSDATPTPDRLAAPNPATHASMTPWGN